MNLLNFLQLQKKRNEMNVFYINGKIEFGNIKIMSNTNLENIKIRVNFNVKK